MAVALYVSKPVWETISLVTLDLGVVGNELLHGAQK